MRCGILLPHFGDRGYIPRLLNSLTTIEAYGFDSVWVRDHFVYRPDSAADDGTWVDPMVVLAAVAARTRRVVLGTAVLAPHRHPVHLAVLLSSLASVAGEDRLIAALGMGSRPEEFASAGLPTTERGRLLEEQVDLIRALWAGAPVAHQGRYYTVENVPFVAAAGLARTPLWYGGVTPRAVERAVRRFDGLLLSRVPNAVLRERVDQLRTASAARGRAVPTVGLVVQASPGRTFAEATSMLDLPAIMAHSARFLATEVDSIDGLLVAGNGDDITEQLLGLEQSGVEHVVLDLRARFADWEQCLELLGEAVLPGLRRSTAATAATTTAAGTTEG